ncbi:hypothetical protein AHF37_12675 [Paragonimus kellicotti]|nr:hypothetical protein AHF37_12675 [Paragonimus kellicotti]
MPYQDLCIEKDIAAITLQQLVRGRAIQTQMFEGKEKRRELIAELRSTHALLEDDQAEKRRQKLSILSTQEEHARLIHEVSYWVRMLVRFVKQVFKNSPVLAYIMHTEIQYSEIHCSSPMITTSLGSRCISCKSVSLWRHVNPMELVN